MMFGAIRLYLIRLSIIIFVCTSKYMVFFMIYGRSSLIELDALVSDNTVTNWSIYERKTNLQIILSII